MNYLPVGFVVVVAGLFLYTKFVKGDAPKKDNKEDKDVKHYEKQNVKFVEGDKSYINTMAEELANDRPHFDTLRQEAASSVKGVDFLGIKMEEQTWLFPVSQKYLKEIYAMNKPGGILETESFSHSVGYAPEGMPFIKSNEHWKELRKNVAAIFHKEFMDQYLINFNTAIKDLVADWKKQSGKTVNVFDDISHMAYDSAMYSLAGGKLDVELDYQHQLGFDKVHLRDFNARLMNDFAKHAATKDFVHDHDYRLKADTRLIEVLNENMAKFGGAFTGVVNARVAEIQGGAATKNTIVDAAIGLTLAGVIKSVGEAVQHGWAILNGAHLNCANALSATLYYLIKNPKVYKKLKDELDSQLLKGGAWDAAKIEKTITFEKLKELDYLSYVVKEALRLSAPIYGKPMTATEDTEIEGFKVTKGTVIYPNNGVLGVSENVWKDPLQFIPERFDPTSEYFKLPNGTKREPITWLAFGAGSRVCMGDNYSMYFVKVGLVYLMTLFEFKIQDEPEVDSFFYWQNSRKYSAKVNAK